MVVAETVTLRSVAGQGAVGVFEDGLLHFSIDSFPLSFIHASPLNLFDDGLQATPSRRSRLARARTRNSTFVRRDIAF